MDPLLWTGTAGDGVFGASTNWNTVPVFNSTTDLVFGTPPISDQTIQISGTVAAQNLTFSGSTRPTYTFSGTSTPDLQIAANIIADDGAAVTFESSLSLTLIGGVHTIQNVSTSNSIFIRGTLGETGGTASLTKTGAGGLYLSGANTYTGGTTISAGSIIVENASGSATGTGTVTIATDATLQIGVDGTTGSISGAIVNDGSIVYARSDSVTASDISGAGSVNHWGSGTVNFSGTGNTYGGGTRIYEGGTFADLNAGAFSANSGVFMHGGTLDINYDETIKGLGDLDFNGIVGGTVDIESGKTLTIAGAGSCFSGTLTGSGRLAIAAGAIQALSGDNRGLLGGLALNGGILQVSDVINLGATAGGISFAGGTLQLMGGGMNSAHDITVNAGGGTIMPNNGSTGFEATFSGAISGSGGLTFQGPGVVQLSGTSSTYEGGLTAKNAAVIDFTSNANLGKDVNVITLNGGYLRTKAAVGDFTHPITLDAGGGNLNSNGFDSVFSGKISGSGALYVRAGSAGGSITLNNAANDYTGRTYLGQDLENTAVATLKISADGNLGLAPSTPTLSHLVLDGGNLVATGSFTLDPNRGIEITSLGGAIGVDGNQSLVYAGNILGDGALTKTGAGNLTLGGDTGGISTFAGGLTVEQGTLTLGRSSYRDIETQEFESSPVGAGILTLLGGTTLAATPESGGPDDGILLFNNLHLGSNESITVTIDTSQDDLTLSGDIGGDEGVGLLKTGAGMLTLAGQNNSFDGGLEVADGTLKLLPMPEMSGGLAGSGTLTLRRGTTLTLPSDMSLSLSNDILLDDPDSGTAGASIHVQQESEGMAALELSGIIADGWRNEGAALSLIKTGSGMLKLDGANTFSGGLVVEEGAVVITRSSQTEGSVIAGPVGVGLLKMGDGTKLGAAGSDSLTLHNDIELGGEVGFGSQTYPLTFAGNLSEGEATGSLRIGGNVVLEGTANTFTGPTSIECGTLRIFGDGSLGTAPVDATAGANHLTFVDGGLIANGTMTLAPTRGIVLGGYGGTLTAPANTTFTVGGTISGSSSEAALTKAGAGTLVLSGTNTYAGWTKIEAGNLRTTGTGTLPATTALGMSTGTKLYIDESQHIARFLGDIAAEVEIAIGSGKTFTVAPTAEALSQGNAGEFSGWLSGSGAFELAGVPDSLLWLRGDLTYSGGTSIATGNTLKISGAATNTSALSHPITANGTLAFYRAEEADDLTVSGSITGSGRVVSYSGFTVLTGTGNNYSGGTEIKSGSVLVGAADGAFGASSGGILVKDAGVVALMNGAHVSNAVTLEYGSTIAGNGTFASIVIVGAGVTLKPELNNENTIGTLTFNELTLNGGGTYEWNMLNASVYDRVSIVDPTTLHFEQNATDAFTFKLTPLSAAGVIGPASGFIPGQTVTFELFHSATMDGFANFNYTIDHSLFDEYMGEATFSLSQSGSSILLNFTPVPEPATWALLITGLAIVGIGALRRQPRR